MRGGGDEVTRVALTRPRPFAVRADGPRLYSVVVVDSRRSETVAAVDSALRMIGGFRISPRLSRWYLTSGPEEERRDFLRRARRAAAIARIAVEVTS